MTNEVKPENVNIQLTWSGEKFVKRAISWSNFSRTDILEPANAGACGKKNYYQRAMPINIA